MRAFLRNRSRRRGFDAWAVQVVGADKPLRLTVSTTREEARAERKGLTRDLFVRTKVVKVVISVEAVK